MRDNIREYAKFGLVHHILYPKCLEDADYHADTLLDFVKRTDIETLDCCLPYGEKRRKRLIKNVKNCKKEITYSLHMFPQRKISLSSIDLIERGLIRLVIKDQIDMAVAIGARSFVFVSGADVPDNRQKAKESFKDFCRWFCCMLKPHSITALLEPFDRDIDKKFLYGPINECVELMDIMSKEVDNLGIELDIGHIPLMGEDLKYAIKTSARYIKRVHLGNCILKNKNNPLYGDKHPPIGIEEGEINIPEIALILENLLEIGYLKKEKRNPLVLEMIPFPGKTVEFTVSESIRRLEEAWKLI